VRKRRKKEREREKESESVNIREYLLFIEISLFNTKQTEPLDLKYINKTKKNLNTNKQSTIPLLVSRNVKKILKRERIV